MMHCKIVRFYCHPSLIFERRRVEHLTGRHSTLGLASKYPTRVEMISNNKHTNVQNWSVDYKEKKFMAQTQVTKPFFLRH
jgi:hypothetical protein